MSDGPLLTVSGRAVPRPGRRAALAVRSLAVGVGTLTVLAGGTGALFKVEARLARRSIGRPQTKAPDPSGVYGPTSDAPVLHLAVVGDSAAAGLGCDRADQTPGALLAGGMARDLGRQVEVRVVARTGARSAALDTQVGRALRGRVDVAFVLVGANDVTHQAPVDEAARDLARAVRTLRAAGAEVVVGTCPDLGTVKPVLQPLRTYARYVSRRLAAAQTVAVVEEGGVAVSLASLLGPQFAREPSMWSADRFHPSPEGYRRVVDAVLPSLLQAAGVEIPVMVPLSDSVQDVALAASVAAREPGLAVETVAGEDGIASAGPGRLARLSRRLPLVGRGAPEARTSGPAPEMHVTPPASGAPDTSP